MSEKLSILQEKATIPPSFQVIPNKERTCKKDDKVSPFRYHDYTYSTTKPNNCVLLKTGDFVLVNLIEGFIEADMCISGTKLNITSNAYDHPIKSGDLNIHMVSESRIIVCTIHIKGH